MLVVKTSCDTKTKVKSWGAVSNENDQQLLTVKSSQVKVYSSRRQKSHMQRQWARLARRGWCAGVVSSHCPPVPRKDPAKDEASEAPRAGRGSVSFSGLVSGVRVLSPALSVGRPGFRGGGNPISIDQRPKPRKEG